MPETSRERFPTPEIAIDFLSKKVNVNTDAWDDLKWGEHAHAFTVAHSNEASVLDTIHGLLNEAIKEGLPIQDFQKGMLDMMEAAGWYGGAEHTEDDKKYIKWRIKTIYHTNMRTAYAAEHYRKQLGIADMRPIWVYQSKLVGDNRRQEHIDLHDKAFRHDDPFWDTHYPPNGWNCECYVTTKSESGAKRAGLTVEESKDITVPDIDSTWKYNVGKEALAPNFNKYENLPEETLKQIYENYHRSMNNTRLTQNEFKTLLKTTNTADYKRNNITYQVGNLETKRYEVMRDAGVVDSKIMATDNDLWHGTGDKNAKQTVPEHLFDALYKTLGEPEAIYEESVLGKPYRVFHFVTDTGDEKKIKVLLHTINIGNNQTSLRISTFGHSTYEYKDKKFKKIW